MLKRQITSWMIPGLIALMLVTNSLADIVITTPTVTLVASPSSVIGGVTENNTDVLAFNEKHDYILPSDTVVNISTPGDYPFPISGLPVLSPATIPAGTRVDSHLLHFDAVGSTFPPVLIAEGSVTFDCDVVGIVVLSADLDNSDGQGLLTTSYPVPGLEIYRGLEERDSITLSADRRTVTVHLETSLYTDQIRVITQCPPPGSCPHTIGYWKNHPSVWPVQSLVLGDETYSQAELLTILKTPPRGDASLILAHQLIATKLSIASGSTPAPISATVAHADGLLAPYTGKLPYGIDSSSAAGQAMVSDSTALDSYNNSVLTPDCTN